jgi:Tol biopolymer transport system component
VEGHRVQRVAEASAGIFSPRWSADGEAIFYLLSKGETEDLMRVPVDPRSGAAAGPASPLLTGLATDDSFSLSGDREQMAYARAAISSHLYLLTLGGPGTGAAPRVRPLTTGTGWSGCPSISPDGRELAFDRSTSDNTRNIFVMPMEGGSPRQVTHTESENLCPVWSPDGTTLAFGSNEGGSNRLWTVDTRGGTPRPFNRTRLSTPPQLAWAPGARLLYLRLANEGLYVLDPVSAEQRPLQADGTQTLESVFSPRYAPDGRRVAVWGLSTSASRSGLWTFGMDDGPGTLLQEGSGVARPVVGWSEDGAWIYVLERGIEETRLARVHSATGESRVLTVLPEDIHRGLGSGVPHTTMTRDGRQFVFPVRQAAVSDVMLVESFDPASY